MKPLFFFLLTILSAAADLRVATFNIRYANDRPLPENWDERKPAVLAAITEMNPDILGVQEAVHEQVLFIEKAVPGFTRLGVGRADGKEGGEYSPIFFRKERFKVKDHGTFWLSETPNVPGSKSWDNQIERIVTWAELLHKDSGHTLLVLNTHWDHKGQVSREKSAEFILKFIADSKAEKVILLGDFNATPENPAIKTLTATGLQNALPALHPNEKNLATFHGWTGKKEGRPIGHIFFKGGFTVNSAEVIHYKFAETWPSDHFPVLVTGSFAPRQ